MLSAHSNDGPSVQRRRPTLYDVAEQAGVSHQTVSRLVRGQTNINPEIRIRIEAAIVHLGYKPNRAARSLATSRPHRIGALFYDRLDKVGPSRIVQAAGDAAREAGYLLDIVGLDPRDDHAIDNAIQAIDQTDVAGIMVFAPTDRVLRAVARVQFAVPVYVESDANETEDSRGPTPNETGARELMSHLAAHGHRRFFHISGPLDWVAARGRRDAYDAVIREKGLVDAGSVEGDWTAESGYAAASRMPLDRGVTALVVGNDQMALGALKALEERGIRVPLDISVVGFDDIPEARFFKPPLTTVRLDFEQQGRVAMGRLLALIDPRIPRPDLPPLSPQLKQRGSTSAAPSTTDIP